MGFFILSWSMATKYRILLCYSDRLNARLSVRLTIPDWVIREAPAVSFTVTLLATYPA
jgi:hypothetical protein